jgi:hypothetical protein
MNWKDTKTSLRGLIGGLGVVAFLAGPLTGLYKIGMAIFLAFAVWIAGATLINVFID